MAVPEEVVSGNHEQIRRWRRQKALAKTLHNRPDLLERGELSAEDRKLLAQMQREQKETSGAKAPGYVKRGTARLEPRPFKAAE
jgi:hypothetical protein